MESVSNPATSIEIDADSAAEAASTVAVRDTLRAYFAGFGIADRACLASLAERFIQAAREAGDVNQAPALAEVAVGDWFRAMLGARVERAELAADIGRLAALKSGVFGRQPERFLAEGQNADLTGLLRRKVPTPPTVSLMTPMPTQSLACLSFVPNARRALALLQIRRA
ncbi:MAG: hypothetical protein AB7G15_13230 [Alphaproteobacteria bacterium]